MQNRILDNNYEAVNLKEKVDEIQCLSDEQTKELKEKLRQLSGLFSGKLLRTVDIIEPIHLLKVKEGAKLVVHANFYPVPTIYKNVAKKESFYFVTI